MAPTRTRKKHKKPHTPWWVKTGYLSFTTLLAASLAGVALHHNYNPEHIHALGTNTNKATSPLIQPVAEEAEFMVIAGVDDRSGMSGRFGNPEEITGVRADAIMLVAIPKDNRHAVAMSIPRDALLSRPECQQWESQSNAYTSTTLPAEENVKINSIVHDGGPACFVEAFENTTGVTVTRYAQVNFQAFEDIVDSLKGITMCFEQPIIDQTLGAIIPEPGTQIIDGATALSLARARTVEGTGMSDFDRGQRQQKIAIAIYQKMKDQLTNPVALLSTAKKAIDNIQGDGVSATDLMQLMGKVSTLDASTITFITAPVIDDGTNDPYGGVILDQEAMKNIINDALKETNAPTISGAEITTYPIPPRSAMRIVVRANEETEEVTKTINELRTLGWEVSFTPGYVGKESSISFGIRSVGASVQASADMMDMPMRSGDTDPNIADLVDAGPVLSLGESYMFPGVSQRVLEGIEVPVPRSDTKASDYLPVDLHASLTEPIHANRVCEEN